MNLDVIKSLEDVQSGCDYLVGVEPLFGGVLNETGLPPLRLRSPGLAGLAQIITGQQLSNASARAIWGRVEKAVVPFTAEALGAISDETLRGCGLSAGKVKTLRGILTSLDRGSLSFGELGSLNDEDITAQLTSVSGIGPWTAELYLLTCLGRRDVWPAGDLALQVAVMTVFDLDMRPSAKQMADLSTAWRPWRAVAARLLWAYYSRVIRVPKTQKEDDNDRTGWSPA